MALKIMQEVTDWKNVARQPNHVYLMSGDKALAYSRWGEGDPEYFSTYLRLDRRGRKFVEVKQNPWGFDLSIKTEPETEAMAPSGQTWQVSGSKGNQYTVSLSAGRWSCTCPGHSFRGQCRHITEVSAAVPA
jgi:hypothetical protein